MEKVCRRILCPINPPILPSSSTMSKRGGDQVHVRVTKVKKRKGVGSRTITVLDSDEEGPFPIPSNEYARVTKTRVGTSGKAEKVTSSSVSILEVDQLNAPALLEEDAGDSVGVVVGDGFPTMPAKQRKRANDSVSFQPYQPLRVSENSPDQDVLLDQDTVQCT